MIDEGEEDADDEEGVETVRAQDAPLAEPETLTVTNANDITIEETGVDHNDSSDSNVVHNILSLSNYGKQSECQRK